MAIRIVSCTRLERDGFPGSLLGQSLEYLRKRVKLHVFVGNHGAAARGLGEHYNSVIAEAYRDDFVVFVHDDVAIRDWLLPERLSAAFAHFDVVGVVGNARPDWSQPNWGLVFDQGLARTGWQSHEHFSGRVMHRLRGRMIDSAYGPWPRAVKALDGLFIAVRVSALLDRGLLFDPQFRFHCYDIDFCRRAAAAGLRIGTWPIAVVHGSGGNFASEAFRSEARRYVEKWVQAGPG